MNDPHDDETRPLPPAAGEPAGRNPAVPDDATTNAAPVADGEAPAWTRPAPEREATAPTTGDPVPVAAVPHAAVGSAPADTATTEGAGSARRRWSGRTTAVVVAAALGIGALGAVGAAAAVVTAGSQVQGDVSHRGQLPGGGQGQQFGDGRGQRPGDGGAPDGGRGGLPGGPPPGGFERDGDRHGGDAPDVDGDDGTEGLLPGPDGGTDSTHPGDADGTETALDT